MARTSKTVPQKIDTAHLISAGVLASVCPRELIDEVLRKTGKAICPRYPHSVALNFQMPVGKFSTTPSGLGFLRDGVFTPLEGSYQFQAGDVVREATASPTGIEGFSGSPAVGIRQSSICTIQGQRLELLGRFAPSDELLLI